MSKCSKLLLKTGIYTFSYKFTLRSCAATKDKFHRIGYQIYAEDAKLTAEKWNLR